MKGKGRGLPPKVVKLRSSPPDSPSPAALLAGLQLVMLFLKIGSKEDRKKVLDLAKQLAPIDAGTER
jgi:hypothetical protein